MNTEEIQIAVGDVVREKKPFEGRKESLTGKVTEITKDGEIHIKRSDGQLWITRKKFHNVTWIKDSETESK